MAVGDSTFLYQGVGKQVLLHFFGDYILGDTYVYVPCLTQHVTGEFNGLMANKLLANVDEVSDAARDDEVASRLRTVITEPKNTINQKHVDSFQVQACERYILTTNKSSPLIIMPGDRRWACFEAQTLESILQTDPGYYASLTSSLGSSAATHFFHFLMRRDLTHFRGEGPKPPMTQWKQDIVSVSAPLSLQFMIDYAEDGQSDMSPTVPLLWASFKKWCAAHGHSLQPRNSRDYSSKHFTMDLKAACGLQTRVLNKAGTSTRCFFYNASLEAVEADSEESKSKAFTRELLKTFLGQKMQGAQPSIRTSPPARAMAAGAEDLPGGSMILKPDGVFIDRQLGCLCAVHALRNASNDRQLPCLYTQQLLVQGAHKCAADKGDPPSVHYNTERGDMFSIEALCESIVLGGKHAGALLAAQLDETHASRELEPSQTLQMAFQHRSGLAVLGLVLHDGRGLGHYVALRTDAAYEGQALLLDSKSPGTVTLWSAAEFHRAVHAQRKTITGGKIKMIPRFRMIQMLDGTLDLHDERSAAFQAQQAAGRGDCVDLTDRASPSQRSEGFVSPVNSADSPSSKRAKMEHFRQQPGAS